MIDFRICWCRGRSSCPQQSHPLQEYNRVSYNVVTDIHNSYTLVTTHITTITSDDLQTTTFSSYNDIYNRYAIIQCVQNYMILNYKTLCLSQRVNSIIRFDFTMLLNPATQNFDVISDWKYYRFHLLWPPHFYQDKQFARFLLLFVIKPTNIFGQQ